MPQLARWPCMAAFALLALPFVTAGSAEAQKRGGVLRAYSSTNPPSASIHEELTIATNVPFMGVFNNLVLFDPKEARNSESNIIPELGESWSWDEGRTKLTFKLRQGVKWHDGKPFTSKDVQCTWHRLIGKEPDYFRRVPRRIWWENLKEVTIAGDYEATFHLERPQASFLSMLASGMTPVYPCHVSGKDMRTHPIGTGPFKFVELKRNESIKFVRNPDYWKPDRPYLDGIEWRIIQSRGTRVLAFAAGEFDLTFNADFTAPVRKDLEKQAPTAICKTVTTNVPTQILINSTRPPLDNVQLRRVISLAIDRQAFIDIVSHGESTVAANMMTGGNWAMPLDMLKKLPGYGDTATQQEEARKIMASLGYGPSNRLKLKVSTRDFNAYKDPAMVLVDQLNKVYFDAELEIIDAGVWYNRMAKIDYAVALTLTGSAIDDPDVALKSAFSCKSEVNYTKYCNPKVDQLLTEQSEEADVAKRKQKVWEIERILAEDVARPVVFHSTGATCWYPQFKGFVLQSNSLFNGWRFEGVWLDK